MKKKILIIGGTGFIGINLIKKFNLINFKIYSLSRKKPSKKEKIKLIKYLTCDLSNKKKLNKILKKLNFNYVINLGGEINHKNRIRVYKSHYIGVNNLIEIFLKKKIEKFIQIGSSIENGNIKSPQIENFIEQSNVIKSSYGSAKNLATKKLLEAYKKHNFPVTIFRLYQVFGPFQKTNRLIPFVIKNCLENKAFPCSNAKQLRDFIYVDDVVALIKKSIKNKNSNGKIFNLGSGKSLKVIMIIKMIVSIIKKGKPIYGKIKIRADESPVIFANIKKAKKHFNWKPKIPFVLGLKRTINYYKSQ